jgi:serine/threonine-protein kinase
VHFGTLLGPAAFSRVVAIKRLHPHCAKDAELVALLLDEARLAARIRHPNVVSTLDVVVTDANVLLVMEYLKGESLANLLGIARSRDARVPVPIAAALIAGFLHGLHAVHALCCERPDPRLYRDISAANMLVDPDGAAKWINVARVRGRAGAAADDRGSIEQFKRHAEVAATSVIFWECLTGRRLSLETQWGAEAVEPPSKYAIGLGAQADAIVLRGLARALAGGYATAREMALAIETAMPLASASQVGAWVEELAHDALAQRSRQIAQIEGAASSGDASETVYATARLPTQNEAQATDLPAPSESPPQDEPGRIPWPHRKALWIAVATICVPLAFVGAPRLFLKPSASGPVPNTLGPCSGTPCAPAPQPSPSCSAETEQRVLLPENAPAESILGFQRDTAPKTVPPALSAPRATASSAPKPSRSMDKDEIL